MEEGRLLLGCKKEGCNGVMCVENGARHGTAHQCPRCLNKQKYCADCKQLYINFRRHRQLGHELYEFQRKRQVLMRNNHGLFIPGKYATGAPTDHDQSKRKAPSPFPVIPQHIDQRGFRHVSAYPRPYPSDMEAGGELENHRENSGQPYIRDQPMDVGGELDDASDILVKLLHSSNKNGQGQSPQRAAPNGGSTGMTPPRAGPSSNGPSSSSAASASSSSLSSASTALTTSSSPLPIATTHQHQRMSNTVSNWTTPFVAAGGKLGDPQQPQHPFGAMNWGPPAGPVMHARVMHHHHHHPYHPVAPPRSHLAHISVSQV